MSDTDNSTRGDILVYFTQSELAKALNVSRQAISKRLKNPTHRALVRFDDKGRVCMQDYQNLPKLSPGRQAKVNKNAVDIEPA